MICYILYSPSRGNYYVGITTETIEARIHKHNTSFHGQHLTSVANDWEYYHVIFCSCKTQMLQIEKHIKKMKSKVYLQNLKRYEELSAKLLERFPCN